MIKQQKFLEKIQHYLPKPSFLRSPFLPGFPGLFGLKAIV